MFLGLLKIQNCGFNMADLKYLKRSDMNEIGDKLIIIYNCFKINYQLHMELIICIKSIIN